MTSTPDHRDLMQHHVEALFTHNASSELLRINEPNGSRAPRFFLGRTAAGIVLRFRDDLDVDVRRQLEAAADRETTDGETANDSHAPMHGVGRYDNILAQSAPIQKTWAGPAFVVPPQAGPSNDTVRITETNAEILRAFFEGWIADVPLCQPMFAVVADNRAVCLCCSVRQTSVAHEAGVDTVASYRGRGYAGRAVTAWALAVYNENRIPLYSTSSTNDGSQAVAKKLGLILFGHDLHIT